jgi:putative redox protein
MDVLHILRKQRQPIEHLSIRVLGTRADAVPAPFKRIELAFHARAAHAAVIDDHKLQRAVQLAVEKYCSVAATLDPQVLVTWTAQLESAGSDQPGQPA